MFDLNLGAAGRRWAPVLQETGPVRFKATPSARFVVAGEWIPSHALRSPRFYDKSRVAQRWIWAVAGSRQA